jgi:hypothetical protein
VGFTGGDASTGVEVFVGPGLTVPPAQAVNIMEKMVIINQIRIREIIQAYTTGVK